MSFRLVLTFLIKLLELMVGTEELGKIKTGQEKKEQVLQAYSAMLAGIKPEQKKRLPAFFTDPEKLANLVDLIVALGNLILGKVGASFLTKVFQILPTEPHE